ncbi:MAG: hypothetical protein ACLT98_15440 [Eggerthellaceae bacterium]
MGRWVISTEVDGTVYYVGRTPGQFHGIDAENDGIILGRKPGRAMFRPKGLRPRSTMRVVWQTTATRAAFSDALAHAEATYDEQARRHDSSAVRCAIAALDAARDSLYRAMAGLSAGRRARTSVVRTLTLISS